MAARRQAQQEVRLAVASSATSQAQLAEQKELYEIILRAQSDLGEAFFLIEGEKIIYANQACTDISGYSQDELLGLNSFLDLLMPTERDKIVARLMDRLSGKPAPSHYETAIQGKKGAVDIEVAVEVLEGATGRLLVMARDITLRKKNLARREFMEKVGQMLTTSLDYEQTLRNIAQLAVPHICDWCAIDILDGSELKRLVVAHVDPKKVQYAYALQEKLPPNKEGGAWKAIQTGEPELIPQLTPEMLNAPGVTDEARQVVADLGLNSIITVPFKVRDQNEGAITMVSAESLRQFDESDLSLAQDLAIRAGQALENARLLEQALGTAAELQQSRDQLRVILENVADGVSVQDKEGKLIFANLAAAHLAGYETVEDFLGSAAKSPLERYALFNEKGEPVGLEYLPGRRALKGELSPEAIVRFKIKGSDVERVAHIKARPVRDYQGQVILAVNIMQDITEQQRIEEQKDEFISIASHELKTPVTSIKVFAQSLLRSALRREDDPRDIERLRAIDRQIDRLIRLIKNILDVSRLESGDMVLNCQDFNLSNLVSNVVERMQAMVDSHTVVLNSRPDVMVQADPDRIEQVLNNLISNAFQHSPEGSRVKLDVLLEEGEVKISVTDEGRGIPPDQIEKTFERFYQVEKDKSKGAGLGLYISRQIMQQHDGRIEVSSRPGEGSTFTVVLPLDKAALPHRQTVEEVR
jgi:PAS domain S-box-containing protein